MPIPQSWIKRALDRRLTIVRRCLWRSSTSACCSQLSRGTGRTPLGRGRELTEVSRRELVLESHLE